MNEFDAVKLYAWSLRETLLEGSSPLNGTLIIQKLKNKSYLRYAFTNFECFITRLCAIEKQLLV